MAKVLSASGMSFMRCIPDGQTEPPSMDDRQQQTLKRSRPRLNSSKFVRWHIQLRTFFIGETVGKAQREVQNRASLRCHHLDFTVFKYHVFKEEVGRPLVSPSPRTPTPNNASFSVARSTHRLMGRRCRVQIRHLSTAMADNARIISPTSDDGLRSLRCVREGKDSIQERGRKGGQRQQHLSNLRSRLRGWSILA